MAPHTRSRNPVAPPPSRVYRSTPPSHRVQFPARRRELKTYSNRRHSARSLRQQTLTQIDYLRPLELEEEEDREDDLYAMEEESRPQKRRKTTGDVPNSTPASTFHTQTLTQLLSIKGEDDDDDDGGGLSLVKDSEDEDDFDLDGSQKENITPRKQPGKGKEHGSPLKAEEDRSSRATSMIPQTPAHKRLVAEIPSSQPSPFTPMLEKYTISPHRSPLKGRSTNTEAPAPTAVDITSTKSRRLVIEDTFSPVAESVVSSKPPSSNPGYAEPPVFVEDEAGSLEIPDSDDDFGGLDNSPAKSSITTDTPTGDEHMEPGTPTPMPHRTEDIPGVDLGVQAATPTPFPGSQLEVEPEIPVTLRNSTPECFPEEEEEEEAATSEPASPSPNRAHKIIFQSSDPEAEKEKETPLSSPHRSSPSKATPYPRHTQPRSTQFETQFTDSQRVPHEVIRDLGPQTDRSDIILSIHPEHVDAIAAGTKNHEFRNYRFPPTVSRIWVYVTRPACELRYMATVSGAKEPGQIDDRTGVGNAEFNRGKGAKFAYELLQVYQINNPVSLALMREYGWIEGPPQKYVYVPPAVVGELLANLRCALFAEPHEIQQEDEEEEEEEKRRRGGGGGGASVEGHERRCQGGQLSSGNTSVSQEVEKQLRSDIEYSTQFPSDLGDVEVIPSSQGTVEASRAPPPATTSSSGGKRTTTTTTFAKPKLPPPRPADMPAAAAAAGRRSTPGGKAVAEEVPFVRPSQATTVSQPSTPVTTPDKSVPRPQPCSSVPSLPDFIDDSPIRLAGLGSAGGSYSLGSSQAMVHDSLVADVRAPPAAWDSGDDDEE